MSEMKRSEQKQGETQDIPPAETVGSIGRLFKKIVAFLVIFSLVTMDVAKCADDPLGGPKAVSPRASVSLDLGQLGDAPIKDGAAAPIQFPASLPAQASTPPETDPRLRSRSHSDERMESGQQSSGSSSEGERSLGGGSPEHSPVLLPLLGSTPPPSPEKALVGKDASVAQAAGSETPPAAEDEGEATPKARLSGSFNESSFTLDDEQDEEEVVPKRGWFDCFRKKGKASVELDAQGVSPKASPKRTWRWFGWFRKSPLQGGWGRQSC